MPHQLLLDGERRSGLIQPRTVAVPERVPANIAADPGCNTSLTNVLLLNLLLMVRLLCDRVGEQPPLRGREGPFLVEHQSLDHCRIERNAIPANTRSSRLRLCREPHSVGS